MMAAIGVFVFAVTCVTGTSGETRNDKKMPTNYKV